MGKASKFFRSLLGFKTPEPTAPPNKQPKRRWSFVKSHRDKSHLRQVSDGVGDGNDDPGKHAIAVAAATAAVAEAAVAAAEAAAEVVRMTSRAAPGSGGSGYGLRAEWAAVKIQSYFRAYLARRALRALKALVKLQALVRGHILRKQTADMMRRLHALIRAQARARECRSRIYDSPQSNAKGFAHIHLHGPPTPEKFEHVVRTRVTKCDQPSKLKKKGSKSYARAISAQTFRDHPIDDETSDKILEIDTVKPHVTQPRRRNLFQQDQMSYSNSQSLTTSRGSTIQQPGPSPTASCEVNSQTTPFGIFARNDDEEDVSFCTAQNSSLRVGPFTPAKSDSSRSCLSGYSDHPNYMAYTESSRAKVRSVSAPKQRPQYEFSSTTKRYSVYGYGSGEQRVSTLRDFASKAYPGSGRLDRLGMPVGGLGFRESEVNGIFWN